MPMNQKQWTKQLKSEGWAQKLGGNHVVKMTKKGHRPITLPHHKGETYTKGLDAEIRRQADGN